MRTLDEIVAAVRSGEETDPEELRRAVVAFDVMLAIIDLSNYPDALPEYFRAATSDPKEYAGAVNDPDEPEARAWYREMRRVSAAAAELPPVICGNCDTALPLGCCGEFIDEDACALNDDD